MSTPIEQNTLDLQDLLDLANSLPDAGGSTEPVVPVEQATPTISVSSSGLITATSEQAEGYVGGGTKTATKQLTTQAAQTITPGTSDQTIPFGLYLTGEQTIKGDSDLKAANIKKGVSIFGVDGNYEASGGGGTDQSASILDKTITSYSNSTLTELGSYALRECTKLTTLDLPAATEIGSYSCYNCKGLTSLNVPLADTIGQYAFYGCNALKTLNLPKAESLGNRAVSGSQLKTLDLGACTALNDNALYGCSSLNTIVLRSSTLCSLTNVNAFNNTCFASGKAGGTAYVQSALIASYQTATNWATLYTGGTCTFVAIEGSDYE